MTRKSALLILLAGGHIDVPTRESLCINRDTVLKLHDLVKLVVGEVKANGKFPLEYDANIPQDGMCVVRRGWRYGCISQRTRADNPTVVAEQCEKSYFLCSSAVKDYLRWNLNLPGRLDGIKVV